MRRASRSANHSSPDRVFRERLNQFGELIIEAEGLVSRLFRQFNFPLECFDDLALEFFATEGVDGVGNIGM